MAMIMGEQVKANTITKWKSTNRKWKFMNREKWMIQKHQKLISKVLDVYIDWFTNVHDKWLKKNNWLKNKENTVKHHSQKLRMMVKYVIMFLYQRIFPLIGKHMVARWWLISGFFFNKKKIGLSKSRRVF